MLNENTFERGMDMDLSGFIMPANKSRRNHNVRILDLDGSRYVITSIGGTEIKFQIPSGYVPLASKAYNSVLYFVLFDPVTSETQLGSFPSPNYSTAQPNVAVAYNPAIHDFYRPLNNYGNPVGPFTYPLFNFTTDSFVKLEIQPDYDDTVNLIITCKDNKPRLINSTFAFNTNGFTVIRRLEDQGNSNIYTEDTVEAETALILRSTVITKVEFVSVNNGGGKLKPGNYQYIFAYQTEDFNETDVVAQSFTVPIYIGTTYTTARGGSQFEESDKSVSLRLTNLDTSFKYLKVYFKYNSGENSVFERLYEMDVIELSTDEYVFTHTGFEEVREVALETINVDYTNIESAASVTQVKGYLMLGGIKESSFNLTQLREGAKAITTSLVTRTVGNRNSYLEPVNVYNYLNHFGAETYPYGIVFILPDGSLSPVFPVFGKDLYSEGKGTGDGSATLKDRGLFRYPDMIQQPIDSTNGIISKGVRFTINTGLPLIEAAIEQSVGFFFVRGERVRDQLTQGWLIPTFRAPAVEWTDYGSNYYYDTFNKETDYKFIPTIDGLIEAHSRFGRSGAENNYVLTATGAQENGFMLFSLNYYIIPNTSPVLRLYDLNHWAMLSADVICNTPEYISYLSNRQAIGLSQLYKGNFIVNNVVSKQFTSDGNNVGSNLEPGITGTHYVYLNLGTPYDFVPNNKKIDIIRYVEGETLIGNEFASKIRFFGKTGSAGANQDRLAYFYQSYNPYFGIKVQNLIDNSPGPDNPIGAGFRNGKSLAGLDTIVDSNAYLTLASTVSAAFLVALYPRESGLPIDDPALLYPNLDRVTYKQISQRYSWNEISGTATIDCFQGDAYIGVITHKLNQVGSPFRDRSQVEDAPTDQERNRNIDSGILITMLQESRHNPYMRLLYQQDASDLEKRTFFPYRNNGDVMEMRKYRYPDTTLSTLGSPLTLAPKNFYYVSENVPFIKSNYYTRVIHSSRHIPNAFRNGYRTFEGNNSRDYDASMGAIVDLLNHRDNLLVVFEHGIGIGSVEQRIQTGADLSGAIFVESKEVLPPNLSFYSKEIGCQHPKSIVQTPSAVYGFDAEKRKIWQIRDNLVAISDLTISSFLEKLQPVELQNIRTGYNFKYNEVVFTNDYWTLVFREGLETFSSFYSFKPLFYARRANEFYSLNSGSSNFHLHDVEGKEIYGQVEPCYVEFVVNTNSRTAKVLDFINIISNEIKPEKIEVFTFGERWVNNHILDQLSMNQYVIINDEPDIFTEEDLIRIRDKKIVVQVPPSLQHNSTDEDWNAEGRMRNKNFVVRITYNTNKKVELFSIISSFRFSAS